MINNDGLETKEKTMEIIHGIKLQNKEIHSEISSISNELKKMY
jgi:hypothetical protein